MAAVKKITKVLSTNDASVNSAKGHGVLIPKDPAFQSFFPRLDTSLENPSIPLICQDASSGETVELVYRFYNKTKNEYRITGIAKFLRANNAVPGSRLSLSKSDAGDYVIGLEAPRAKERPLTGAVGSQSDLEEQQHGNRVPTESDPGLSGKRKRRLGMELTFAIIGEWEVVS